MLNINLEMLKSVFYQTILPPQCFTIKQSNVGDATESD